MKPYYEHSGITIYHGDCLEVLPTVTADVLVTDPPYGIAHESGWNGPFQNTQIANDADTSLRDHVLEWWSDKPAVVFGTWKRSAPLGSKAAIVWNKGPASGMGDLSIPWKQSWELVFICGEGFHGSRDEGVVSGHTVVTWASKGRSHPNEKPVSLLNYLIGKCPDGTVVDPFMGSGTTLVAAKQLGRHAIGIELEEKYCEIAARRLSQQVLDFAPKPKREPEQASILDRIATGAKP